jgi:hypothetical protein
MNSPADQEVSEGLERFIQSREGDGHQPSSHRRVRSYLDRLMPFFFLVSLELKDLFSPTPLTCELS